MIGVAWIRFSPLDQFTATRKLGCSKVRAASTEASGVRGGLGRTGTLLGRTGTLLGRTGTLLGRTGTLLVDGESLP